MEGFLNWLAVNRHFSKGAIFSTQRVYSRILFLLAERKLSTKVIEEIILHLRKIGRSNSTINNYINVFKNLDRYNKTNFTEGIEHFPKNTRVPTILSIEEIEAIIEAPITRQVGVRGVSVERTRYLNQVCKLLVWFIACTGCRIDEACSLKKENLALGINVSYAEFKDTKTYLDRRVPLPPLLVKELEEFTKEKKPNDLVFLSSRGNKMVEQTFNGFLREKVLRAGVNKHVYCHCFRNSFIMEHLRCGTDVLTIAKLVGHADVNTTMGYTKFNYEMLVKGASNHPLFSKSLQPKDLIKKIADVVDRWTILSDKRFSFRREINPNSFLFEVYIK